MWPSKKVFPTSAGRKLTWTKKGCLPGAVGMVAWKGKEKGLLRRMQCAVTLDLAVEDGEHLLPGKQRGKVLCVHSISLSQVPIS